MHVVKIHELVKQWRGSDRQNPRDANKTRWSRIDVDPSQRLLGPSNGICSNLLERLALWPMVKMLISQACLTFPDDRS